MYEPTLKEPTIINAEKSDCVKWFISKSGNYKYIGNKDELKNEFNKLLQLGKTMSYISYLYGISNTTVRNIIYGRDNKVQMFDKIDLDVNPESKGLQKKSDYLERENNHIKSIYNLQQDEFDKVTSDYVIEKNKLLNELEKCKTEKINLIGIIEKQNKEWELVARKINELVNNRKLRDSDLKSDYLINTVIPVIAELILKHNEYSEKLNKIEKIRSQYISINGIDFKYDQKYIKIYTKELVEIFYSMDGEKWNIYNTTTP